MDTEDESCVRIMMTARNVAKRFPSCVRLRASVCLSSCVCERAAVRLCVCVYVRVCVQWYVQHLAHPLGCAIGRAYALIP